MEHNERTAILQQDESSQISLKAMLQVAMQQALEVAFEKHIGVERHERSEARTGYRNGHYERDYHTRVGTITLRVCRDRDGKFDPTVFQKYKRSEKALIATIAQMYFDGVSTRKVDGIMETLCGFNVSKSHVSDTVKQLDSELHLWRNRQLSRDYPYLMFDARYEKVRENGHVVSKAFVVVIGISEEGMREVIGCYVIDSESEQGWSEAISDLKQRGLKGVTYIVADDNKGLKASLARYFQGVPINRCQVHFMRNLIGKLSKADRGEGVRLLQDVFSAHTKEDALDRAEKLQIYLRSIDKPTVARWIDTELEETLVVLSLPDHHRKQMKSTNMLERLNQELKRRSRCVRIFPNVESCLRLLSTLCQEISEGWTDKRYINMVI